MNTKPCRRLTTASLLPVLLAGLVLTVALVTCRRFDNLFDPANNRPPDVPANPNPPDGESRLNTVGITLSWTCSDPDSAFGDSLLSYDVYFGIETDPPRAESGWSDTSWDCVELLRDTTYYWRIAARDSRGATTSGPVWSFATGGNLPPHVPSQPVPDDRAWGRTSRTLLSWQGGDPDSGDTVVYDLYLGVDDPPPLVATGLTTPEWQTSNLRHNATCYWRVVARDQGSLETPGPLWQFSTMPQTVFSVPLGGEKWRVGTVHEVRWSDGGIHSTSVHRNAVSAVNPIVNRTGKLVPLAAPAITSSDSTVLYRSTNSGTNWQRVGRVTTPGRYDWSVTGPATTDALLQVRIYVDRDVETATSASFTAYNLPTPITVTRPAVGARWQVNSSQTVRWTGGDGLKDSTLVHLSRDNGRTWIRQGVAAEPGAFDWVVPGPETDSALIRVDAHIGDDLTAGQSARFVIIDATPPDPPVITSPAGGERWEAGSAQDVTWTGGTPSDSSVVYLSRNDGATWTRQGVTTQPGSFRWVVPTPATDSALIRVDAHLGDDLTAGQSARFVIIDATPPDPPVITSPAGGESWEVGSARDVTWANGANPDSSVVYFSRNDGTTWTRQGMTVQPGSFRWVVPAPATDSARVRVEVWRQGQPLAGSSNRFRVVNASYPDSVIATISVGDRPTALAWNSTNGRLYVANRNSGTVSVIDGATNSVIATIPVASSPAALAWDSLRNKIYCANEGSRNVTVIDGADNSVIATVPTGAAPRDICVNPVSGKVYVANSGSGANSVTIIDALSDSVIATVTTGQRPRAAAWNPVNNQVYVACFSGNSVTVIDGETNAVVDSIGVGWSPAAVAVVEDRNHIYVANSGSNSNSVTVIDGATNTVLQHVAVGTKPTAIGWNSTSNKVYVTNEDAASVSVIRTTDRQVIAVIGTGSQPCAVRWLGSSNMVYVPCRGSAELAIINGVSDSRQKLMAVGGEPAAVAANHTGSRVYTANYADGTVTVIGHEVGDRRD